MNLHEFNLDTADFFTLLCVSRGVEKSAKPFLAMVASGEWTGPEALQFLEAVANVWDHPKGNDWEIARRLAECPVEVSKLLLAVAEWREAPPSEWKMSDVIVKTRIWWPLVSEEVRRPEPVTINPDGTIVVPDNSGNGDLQWKDVAQRVWTRIGPAWTAAGRTEPTPKQLTDASGELYRRTLEIRSGWEAIFGKPDDVG